MQTDRPEQQELSQDLPPGDTVAMSQEEFGALVQRAEGFLANGLWQQAATAFAGLGVIAPDQPRVFLGMGQACHQLRWYGAAYLIYSIAVELDPGDRALQALRAECALLALAPQDAQPFVAEALAGPPPDGRAAPYLQRLRRMQQSPGQTPPSNAPHKRSGA